ncbi:hypothetical protein LTS08_008884 [Lithohypha guttulata]|uniref:uncharacterized protein n=1 Tax=Lithohypha guttulata TaxID=1690604 RepID=UPI002DDE9E9A|nr:hypothetical protein LTS08_008884 [Lithohypha guttulata]
MASSEVQRIWNDAVADFEASTSTKLDSLPVVSSAIDIVGALQIQETKFGVFRNSTSKVDKIRSAVKQGLHFVDQISKILASALSSNFAPASGIFAAVGFLVQTTNKVSADYDNIAEFFEDVQSYLEQLKLLERHVTDSLELQAMTAKVLAAMLVFCGVCVKHIQMGRRRKALRTLLQGGDTDLAEAKRKFRQACENEQRMIEKLSYDLLKQNKNDHVSTRAAIDSLGRSSKQLEVNTFSLNQATRSMQSLLEVQKTSVEREKILKSLSLLDFLGKQQDAFAKYRSGTCDWVVAHPNFQTWMRSGRDCVLWCPGKPGTGKTIFTSFAIDFVNEHTRNSNAAIVSVYCDYNDPRTYSEVGLLSSIARQLVEQMKSIPTAVTDFCEKQTGRRRAANSAEWVDLIKTIHPLFDNTFLFVDALDECPVLPRESFVRVLSELSSSIAIFVTSHPDLELDIHFTHVRQIEITATKSAIAAYLTLEIPQHPFLRLHIKKDPDLEQEIINAIQKSANGMFLLVSAQLEYLSSQPSVKETRDALRALPNKISDYYAQAFQRIEKQVESNQILAKKAISYVQCARRPLTAVELTQALSLQPNAADLNEKLDYDREVVLAVCLRLLHFNKVTTAFTLVHGTLNTYLNEHPQHLLPDFKTYFARICLTSLMLEPFRNGCSQDLSEFEQKLNHHRFWVYACHHWFYHVSAYQTVASVQGPLLIFLNDKNLLSACVQTLYASPLSAKDWHERYPRNFSQAHLAARCGLHDTFLLYASRATIDRRDTTGMTSLILAAQFGHTTIVQASLDRGADVNACNVNGESGLALAVKNGHTHLVQLLLSVGAQVDMEDNKGWTGLDWAVLVGNTSLVQQFLKSSNDTILKDGKDRRALFLAAEEGHAQIVQLLLDHRVDINTRDAEGSTALDWAVPAGRLASSRTLLENGASIDCRDNYENTVLHWAIQDGDMVDLLIKHGAEVDASNRQGQTALCWASQDGALLAAERLLNHGAAIDMRDADGFRPLHRAVLRGRMDMVVLLLDRGAEASVKDDKFWTPLRVALTKEHRDIARLLTTRVPEAALVTTPMTVYLADRDINAYFNTCLEEKAQASTVLTGLRAAVQEKQFERVKGMIEKGADVNAHDTGGWTALMMALWAGDLPIMQLLLEKGAKIDEAGWDGQTALHWAAREGDEEGVRFLIDHSASVDIEAFGQSPAMLAAKHGKTSITMQLIAHGANPVQADYHRRTLMHWAARHGDIALIRTLLDHGADVNTTDRWGRTVLMWALETDGNLLLDYQRLAVMKLLLNNGADVNLQAQHHITALHLAACVGSVPVLQCLLEAHAHLEIQTQQGGDSLWWDNDLDIADIEGTQYNTVRLIVSRNVSGMTARDIACEAGMLAVQYVLSNKTNLP